MDKVWTRDEPSSPCVNICVIHRRAQICVGCYRTMDEIAAWGTMPEADRQALMAELHARAQELKKRRGGRAR
jgi:predicted Fe-S protein YdhL (DUF1289 family)